MHKRSIIKYALKCARRPGRRGLVSVCLALVLVLTGVSPASAQSDKRWSMSVLLGGHLPDLKQLSDGLYDAPLMGEAEILVYEGGQGSGAAGEDVDENITEVQDFIFDNTVPDVGIGTQAGIEFQWHPNDRHSLILGIGSWEKTSINRVIANLPLQQYYVSNKVFSERRDKISYTEYTLGWRYNIIRDSKFNLYTRLTVHEVFDIDYREDFVFRFDDSPIVDLIGVRRVMVVEAQTASLFMGQIGLGGEWFLRDWLSLSVEGGYLVGERKFHLGNVQTKDDFLDSDNVYRNGMPYMRLSNGNLAYLVNGATPADVNNPATQADYYQQLALSFDGWRVTFRISIYY